MDTRATFAVSRRVISRGPLRAASPLPSAIYPPSFALRRIFGPRPAPGTRKSHEKTRKHAAVRYHANLRREESATKEWRSGILSACKKGDSVDRFSNRNQTQFRFLVICLRPTEPPSCASLTSGKDSASPLLLASHFRLRRKSDSVGHRFT